MTASIIRLTDTGALALIAPMRKALLVRILDRQFAIPITAVQEAIMLDPRAVRTVEGR